jgi:hypothetical protein
MERMMAMGILGSLVHLPHFSTYRVWDPNAITFANNTVVGGQALGIFVDQYDGIYLGVYDRNQVKVWDRNGSLPVL